MKFGSLGRKKQVENLLAELTEALGQLDFMAIISIKENECFNELPPDWRLLVHSIFGEEMQARKILDAGADPNARFIAPPHGIHPLYAAACIAGDLPTVDVLLAAGADVDLQIGDGRTALMQAAENGNRQMIDRLLEAGADIDAVQAGSGLGAFAFALNHLQMDIAKYLLTRGAKPDYGNIETLPLAVVEHGDLEFIKAIETHGGTIVPEYMKGRIAFVAARNPDGDVLDHVLAHGADVNHDNDFNYTPLLLAVLNDHVDLVKRFLARGDDPDVLDIDRETALSLAIEKEQHDSVCLLRDHGAQCRDYPGLTDEQAMLQAAEDGALGTALKLRDAGVSLNVEDGEGNTPLMLATRAGHLGVVRSLYHLGADINHRNRSGASAAMIANELDDHNLIATMREFVAEDAIPEEMRGLPLSGIYDVGGMMFGRLSHPFKDKPPYDDSPDERVDDEPSFADKLEQLRCLLNDDNVAEHLGDQGRESVESLIERYADSPDEALQTDHEEVEELIYVLSRVAGEMGDDDDESESAEEDYPLTLHEAIESGDIQTVGRLLQAGADPNEHDDEDTTPLMSAVISGAKEIVELLIREGARIVEALPDDTSVLEIAIEGWANEEDFDIKQQRREILDILLTNCEPEDPSSLIGTVLLTATRGHPEIIDILREKGIAVDADYPLGNGVPLLFTLVARGDPSIDEVNVLLGLGADPNYRSPAGLPVLSLCMRSGSITVADMLIDAGADVMVRNINGALPYDLALIYGHAEFAQRLIVRMNAVMREIDHQDEKGRTALMRAVMRKDLGDVQQLLTEGVDATLRDLSGHSPLSYAVCNDMRAIEGVLRKARVEQEDTDPRDGKLAIIRAAAKGALGTVLDLLDTGVPVDTEDEDGLVAAAGNTALLAAETYPGMIRVLANRGADITHRNEKGDTAYMVAAAANRQLTMQTLVDLGYPLVECPEEASDDGFGNSTDETIVADGEDLFEAFGNGDLRRVMQLIEEGADINLTNEDGISVLALALMKLSHKELSRRHRRDNEQIISALLDGHASITGSGIHSPFIIAAFFKRADLVSRMLRMGADVNQTTEDGASALLLSLSKHDDSTTCFDDACAECLLNAGCDPTLRHESGSIAIHAAAMTGCVSILERLLDIRPMDIDAIDGVGNTPLICAATAGQLDAVKLLLDRGADRSLRDNEGKAAKDIALEASHHDVAVLL